ATRAARAEAKRALVPIPADLAASAADPLDQLTARELFAAVDEEIAALPERFRAPLVLCAVAGLSQTEAAARLGGSVGSVKGRLERARAVLRKRLEARGLTVPAVLFGLLGASGAAAVPAGLVASTRSAVRGENASPEAARLAKEMTHTGGSCVWNPAVAVLVVVGMAAGVGFAV